MGFPEGYLHAVFARGHVLVVHFPVVLLLVAVWFEFVGRRTEAALTAVRLGAIAALWTAWSGWSLAELEPPGSSQELLLFLHRWSGVTVVVLSVATLISRRVKQGRAWRPLLLLTAIAVAATGHFGGTLVHGDIFAFDEPTAATPPISTPADDGATRVDYVTQIQPLLESNCYRCHGPDKAKGRLRLDDVAALFRKSSWSDIIKPGDAKHSELSRRISLPHDDLDIMPAEGPPLTTDQILLVRQWIDEGASYPADRSGAVSRRDEARAPDPPTTPASPQGDRALAPEVTTALDQLVSRGAGALPVAMGEDRIEVSFATLGTGVSDADLSLLDGLGEHLVSLDLSRTAITDDGLAALAGFPSLRRLELDWTAISDAGLGHVSALPVLETLNLVGTPVGDGGVDDLARMSSLRTLYLWNSAVTSDGVARLRGELPDTRIVFD